MFGWWKTGMFFWLTVYIHFTTVPNNYFKNRIEDATTYKILPQRNITVSGLQRIKHALSVLEERNTHARYSNLKTLSSCNAQSRSI